MRQPIMISINLKIPERDLEAVDAIVKESQKEDILTSTKYDNRSDFIRVAIQKLIAHEHEIMLIKTNAAKAKGIKK